MILKYACVRQIKKMASQIGSPSVSTSALRDFEVVNKLWGRALLSKKRRCFVTGCCFVRYEVDEALS